MRIRLVDTIPGFSVEFRDWDSDASSVTLGDLLWERVRREVESFNQDGAEIYNGLVAPEESERVLTGYRLKRRYALDAEQEYQRAVRAFEANRFLVLAGGRPVEALGDEIDLAAAHEVEFVRLS